MPSVSARSDVEPFRAMDVLARANALEAQGRPILHMEVGSRARAHRGPRLRLPRRRFPVAGLDTRRRVGFRSCAMPFAITIA